MDKRKLLQSVKKGLSTRKIASSFSCSQTTVIYWLQKYGLTTKKQTQPLQSCLFCGTLLEGREKRNNRYCKKHCQTEFAHRQYIERWLAGELSGNRKGPKGAPIIISTHVRRWCLERANYKCEVCGWDKVNPFTGKKPLAVHHIDGNPEYTHPDNLQVLCPGCHSLTENYGSLNKKHLRERRIKRV